MDTVIVMTHTKIDYDSRIRRQIEELSKYYDIILCSQRGEEFMRSSLPSNIKHLLYDLNTNGIGGNLLKVYLQSDQEKIKSLDEVSASLGIGLNALSAYETYRCDLHGIYKEAANWAKAHQLNVKAIISNDVAVLPMAYRLRNFLRHQCPQVKLIGDMHELHFEYSEVANQFSKDVRLWLADTYIAKCDIVSTTSDEVVKLYSKRYKRTPITAVRNVAKFYDIKPTHNEEIVKVIHVGAAQKIRKIEKMIECMTYLEEKYKLDLYLTYAPSQEAIEYMAFLNQYIIDNNLQNRVQIREAVKPDTLVETINGYDIGVFYLKPAITNHIYAAPNKLFEYIQGRVAVVTTPLITMKKTVETYDVGVIPEDFEIENFANKIREVGNRLAYYKEQSHKAAYLLNTQKELEKIINYIETGILSENDFIRGFSE